MRYKDDCRGCLKEDGNGNYLYLNWHEGDRRAEYARLVKEGVINQVVGGSGEYEINTTWDIETAYRNLANVCNQCGGLVEKEGEILKLYKAYEGAFVIKFNPCRWEQLQEALCVK